MCNSPLPITVLMPVWNSAHYINNSIDAIRRNIQPYDQVLIVDDCSTDDTLELLNRMDLDQRFVVIRNKDKGLVNALNLGLAEATHNWVARFDVDDKYSDERLNVQRRLLSENTGAIFSDYSVFSDKFVNLGVIPSGLKSGPNYVSLIRSVRTPHPSALLNKSAVMSVGGYRTKDHGVEDLSLWLRLARCSSLLSAPEELLSYRISPNSVTGRGRDFIGTAKTSLLKEFPIPKRTVLQELEDFEITRVHYANFNLETERTMLLLHDLLTTTRFYGYDLSRLIMQEVIHLIREDQTACVKSSSSLFLGLVKRRIARKLF
jgi:glycosyltransferase involved in cell wall biosynthesis